MYDGALTGNLRAAGRSPQARSPAGDRRSPGMRSQVRQRGVASLHQLRDVIARANTPPPPPPHESAEAFDILKVAFPKQPCAFAPSKPWYLVQTAAQQQRTGRSAWTYLNDPV
jgi:hypothetical protein